MNALADQTGYRNVFGDAEGGCLAECAEGLRRRRRSRLCSVHQRTGRPIIAYAFAFGSSFAAPQVSGALALLGQAFPTLSPAAMHARLLASADNVFTSFVSAGEVHVLDGVGSGTFNHDYSTESDHGFLDIRAALQPSGPMPLAEALAARTHGKDLRTLRKAPVNPPVGTFAAHPGDTIELVGPDRATRATLLVSDGKNVGLAVSCTLNEGDLKLDLGLKLARDSGSLMGFSDTGSGGGATLAALTLGLSFDAGNSGFFALTGEAGIADLGGTATLTDLY